MDNFQLIIQDLDTGGSKSLGNLISTSLEGALAVNTPAVFENQVRRAYLQKLYVETALKHFNSVLTKEPSKYILSDYYLKVLNGEEIEEEEIRSRTDLIRKCIDSTIYWGALFWNSSSEVSLENRLKQMLPAHLIRDTTENSLQVFSENYYPEYFAKAHLQLAQEQDEEEFEVYAHTAGDIFEVYRIASGSLFVH